MYYAMNKNTRKMLAFKTIYEMDNFCIDHPDFGPVNQKFAEEYIKMMVDNEIEKDKNRKILMDYIEDIMDKASDNDDEIQAKICEVEVYIEQTIKDIDEKELDEGDVLRAVDKTTGMVRSLMMEVLAK